MVLPTNFLKYNTPHQRKVYEELVSEITDSSEEEINYVAGSKIGIKHYLGQTLTIMSAIKMVQVYPLGMRCG